MILTFIEDKKLFKATEKVIDAIKIARARPDEQLFKNTVDPFSGIFDAAIQNIDIDEWLSQEKSRQIQKTFQNAIGTFHQEIIGGINGWENLGKGHIIDVRNKQKKIIAEIKNKFNTTKGNHKVRVYDDLNSALLMKEYKGFTAYLVEILTQNKKQYDKLFVPPDNQTHTNRPENERIRLISGQLFYDLISREKDALKKLYLILPEVISKITGVKPKISKGKTTLKYLFNRAY